MGCLSCLKSVPPSIALFASYVFLRSLRISLPCSFFPHHGCPFDNFKASSSVVASSDQWCIRSGTQQSIHIVLLGPQPNAWLGFFLISDGNILAPSGYQTLHDFMFFNYTSLSLFLYIRRIYCPWKFYTFSNTSQIRLDKGPTNG